MARKKTLVTQTVEEKIPKKRGRKPKGGKIVDKKIVNIDNSQLFNNVILHLKCTQKQITDVPVFLSNLEYNPQVESVNAYSMKGSNSLQYEELVQDEPIPNIKSTEVTSLNEIDLDNDNKQIKLSTIWIKLKELDTIFRYNSEHKKSACFWCTFDFDTPPIYIPKHYIDKSYKVYGNFCSPECACAYLFNEQVDDSAKSERFYLLNYIYCKIYNYERNIKPAPNPLYILDKFMGNLTIQEYRKLLNHERLLLVIDKPLTKMFPELHEDNNEYNTIGDYKYKLKQRSVKETKNELLTKNFNLHS